MFARTATLRDLSDCIDILFSPLEKISPAARLENHARHYCPCHPPRLVRSSAGGRKIPKDGWDGDKPPLSAAGVSRDAPTAGRSQSFPYPGLLSSGAGGEFCRVFAPPFCSPAQGLRKASLMGIFGAPAPVSLQVRLVRLRIQVDAFGASSGVGVGAGHTHSTGLEQSGGKGHPCFEAATSPGLCPFHPGINPKRCCVHPHPRAAKFTSPLKLRCKWSPLAFLRSFPSRGLKFPG